MKYMNDVEVLCDDVDVLCNREYTYKLQRELEDLGLIKRRKSKQQKANELERLHKSFHYVKGKIK